MCEWGSADCCESPGRKLRPEVTVSGPISSEYPGNSVVSVLAAFFACVSARSARSAFRRRREDRGQAWERDKKAWQVHAGISVFSFGLFVLASYAVWANR
jgi:hypothetical protein